jgi:hypothetical protein
MAQEKLNREKNRTRDNMVQGTSKRRTFGRKRKPKQRKNELRSRRLTHHLQSRREFNKTLIKTYEKMTGLEIAKKIAGSPVGLQNTRSKHWALWMGRYPPKRKKTALE